MVNSLKEPLGQGAAGIVTSALDAVLILDEEMRVVEWSDAAGALFGIDRGEALGSDLGELIVPAELRDSVRDCLGGGAGEAPTEEAELRGRRSELPARHADGAGFRAELTVVRAAAPGAGPTVFARDVSLRLDADRYRALI